MAVVYQITRSGDSYTLSNQGIVSFAYILSLDVCGVETTVLSGNLDSEATVTLTLPQDGKYSVNLREGILSPTITSISSYFNLRNSFIEDVHKIICGCKCKDCGCNDETKCEATLNAINKALLYYTLSGLINETPDSDVISALECRFYEAAHCIYASEFLTGKSNLPSLKKDMVAYLYLLIYNAELSVVEEEDEEALATKFNYAEISVCIRRMGIAI